MIHEDQEWQSNYQDGSHGEGDAVLDVDELILYDPTTKMAYIVARSLSYESQHLVTVNDMNGKFIGQSPVTANGNLVECYGFGIDAGDGNPLNLDLMPIRMDQVQSLFYTKPATFNSQWVAYRSIADTVRWSAERIGPPESAVEPEVGKLSLNDHLGNTRTYGNRESAIYEATRRFWKVKGAVTYAYDKVSLNTAMDYFLQQVKAMSDADGYKSPEGLQPLIDRDGDQWETLDQLAKASHKLIASGIPLARYTEGVFRVVKDEEQARATLQNSVIAYAHIDNIKIALDTIKSLEGKSGVSFEAQSNAVAKTIAQYETSQTLSARSGVQLEESLQPFIHFLGRYESAIQMDTGLDSLLENPFDPVDGESDGTAVDLEGSVALPLDYPQDVLPLPPNGRLVLVDLLGGEGYTLNYIDAGPEASIVSFYEGVLSNEQDYNSMKMQGTNFITASRSPWAISVVITANQMTDEGGFLVSLTLFRE